MSRASRIIPAIFMALALTLYVVPAAEAWGNMQQKSEEKAAEETTKPESAEKTDGPELVVPGKIVVAHYRLTVDGKEYDSSYERGNPLTFRTGENQMLPGFEKGIRGMEEGETRSFEVSPEEGYGMPDERAFMEFPLSSIPEGQTPKKGMGFTAMRNNGQKLNGVISKVTEEAVVVDFNHPLAGKTLNFEVKVLEIKEDTRK